MTRTSDTTAVLGLAVLGKMVLGEGPLLRFVTDRTSSDVARVRQLAQRIQNGTITETELAEYLAAELKGAYNYTDLNRVEYATKYINDYLNGLQAVLDEYRASRLVASDPMWIVPFNPLSLVYKLGWTKEDLPSVSDLNRYLGNVDRVSSQLPIERNLPDTMDNLTYEGANGIEKALEDEYRAGLKHEGDVKQLINNTAAAFVYCGEVFGGEIT